MKNEAWQAHDDFPLDTKVKILYYAAIEYIHIGYITTEKLMQKIIERLARPASIAAGIIWLAVWWHQQRSHGVTQDNEMNLVGGVTWMDSGKFLVLAFVLLAIGLAPLLFRSSNKFSRSMGVITLVVLGLLAVATAFEFWSFPWGSYAITYEVATGFAGSNTSGAVQLLVSLIFTLCLALFCGSLARAKVIPIWLAAILIIGGLTTVYLSPTFWIPGAAWLILGVTPLPKNLENRSFDGIIFPT